MPMLVIVTDARSGITVESETISNQIDVVTLRTDEVVTIE